jgi:hypothetical protein
VVRLIRAPISDTTTGGMRGGIAAAVADDPVRREVAGSGVVPAALLVLIVGLLLVALGSRGRLRRTAAVLLLPVSAAWVAFNGRIEGPVLLSLSRAHGVTASDLLAVVGVLVALAVLLRGRRPPQGVRPPRSPRIDSPDS